MIKHIGVSGTSNPMVSKDRLEQFELALKNYFIGNGEVILHHGDCVGVDVFADNLAKLGGIYRIIHPPKESAKRAFCTPNWGVIRPEKPYLLRNKDIAKECEMLIALPSQNTEVLRSGTWATIRYFKQQDKLVIICLGWMVL